MCCKTNAAVLAGAGRGAVPFATAETWQQLGRGTGDEREAEDKEKECIHSICNVVDVGCETEREKKKGG